MIPISPYKSTLGTFCSWLHDISTGSAETKRPSYSRLGFASYANWSSRRATVFCFQTSPDFATPYSSGCQNGHRMDVECALRDSDASSAKPIQDMDTIDYGHLGSVSKLQKDLDLACSKAMVPLTNGLILQSLSSNSDDGQQSLKSRLFLRHFQYLVSVLEREKGSVVSNDNLVVSY